MSKTSYGLHLHKAGAAFFDKDLMERGKKLRGLVDVLTELFFFRVSDGSWQMAPLLASLDGTSRKTDHFKTDGPHLLIVYKDTIGSDQTILITTEFGRKKLIDDAYGFELVSGDVRHILNDIGQEGYVTLLNEYKVRLEGSERAKGIPLDAIFQHVAAREQILNETHQTFLR